MPGGRAGDDLCACLARLGDGHGRGAVFERCGRILAVVFDPELFQAEQLGQAVFLIQRTPADAQRRVGRGFFDGQQFAVAPHGVRAGFELFFGQIFLDVVIVIDDVENAAAGAVGQIRHGLIFLPAFDAAGAFDIFQHNMCSLFRRIVFIFRPLGGIVVDVLPDPAIFFFTADHMIKEGTLPEFFYAMLPALTG